MIDERGRPEPELCTVLAGRIHDAEVVLAVAEQHVFLALRELGDASHQILNLVVSFPVKRRHQLNLHPQQLQPNQQSVQKWTLADVSAES